MELNKVYQEDCIEGMKKLPDNCIDLTITSPPYNVGIAYANYNDNLPIEDYLLFLENVVIELKRITKKGGRIIFNVPSEINNNLPFKRFIASDIYQIFMKHGLIPMAVITWLESSLSSRTAWGSFCSPSSPAIINPVEYIMVFAKETKLKEGDKLNIDIAKKEFIDWTYGVWTFNNRRKTEHPASFPDELPYRCIRLYSYVNDTILDCFAGSGTTLAVAKQLGRNYIGFELSKEYCKMAEERLKQQLLSGFALRNEAELPLKVVAEQPL